MKRQSLLMEGNLAPPPDVETFVGALKRWVKGKSKVTTPTQFMAWLLKTRSRENHLVQRLASLLLLLVHYSLPMCAPICRSVTVPLMIGCWLGLGG